MLGFLCHSSLCVSPSLYIYIYTHKKKGTLYGYVDIMSLKHAMLLAVKLQAGLNQALQVAFAGGAVMGFTVVGLSLFGLVTMFYIFARTRPDSDDFGEYSQYYQVCKHRHKPGLIPYQEEEEEEEGLVSPTVAKQ